MKGRGGPLGPRRGNRKSFPYEATVTGAEGTICGGSGSAVTCPRLRLRSSGACPYNVRAWSEILGGHRQTERAHSDGIIPF
jgi:hypothetical protein